MTEDDKAVAMVYASPYAWFCAFAQIETKEGTMVKPVPSKFQKEIFQAYELLVSRDLPVRIIAAPKARQSYGSTACGAICYHHVRRTHCSAMVVADETSRVEKLWSMLRRFSDHDGFTSMWNSKLEFNTEKGKLHFVDENKRARFSEWEKETATDSAAGAGGTRQVLWFSEAMRYPREGNSRDTLVIGNALNSLPNLPGTAVFIESTAEGAGGYAYGIWQGAVTLADRLKGKMGNGWIKVFCAWHEVVDYQLDSKREDNLQWFNDEDERFRMFRDRETAGIRRFAWTSAQVAWRRQKLISELDGNEVLFDRDFPEDEDSAFRASGSPRFNPVGTANLVLRAEKMHGKGRIGILVENPGGISFIEDANGWLWELERPTVGTEVSLFADPMTGEQSAGSESRDAHAVGIVRNAYLRNGSIQPMALIAAIHVPGGARWDIDFLAQKMDLLSRYYDGVMAVVEANNSGVALIAELRNLGVPIWRREQVDYINPGKQLKVAGWRTDSKSREIVVEALAKAIRESSGSPDEMVLHVDYLPAAQEFSTFIRKPNGRSEAAGAKHDDFVMGLGICLAVGAYSPITPPARWRQKSDHSGFAESGVCS